MKKSRNQPQVDALLTKLKEAAKSNKGNLLEIAVEAAKARATLGEISFALEEVYGRHVPKENIVRGAYNDESTHSNEKGKKEYENAL